MTTSTEAMRKIAQGELCEFALANGDTVRVLGKPDRGRVKVQINSMVAEYILRDLRSMFDTVGFADETVYNPLAHCAEPDNVTDILECGQYALHVTQDILSPAGVRAVQKFIESYDVDTSRLDWRLYHNGANLLDRVRRLVATSADGGMSDYAASELGNTIARYTIKAGAYWFDIVDSIDWKAGDFGDSGSCYWGCRSKAKRMLTDNGGLALRFFSDNWEDGIGRVWLWPTNDGAAVLFNAYGDIMPGVRNSIDRAAALLSHVTGSKWGKRISVDNNGSDTGTMWINNGAGHTVGYHQHNHCDLCIDDDSYTCEDCGDHISGDDAFFTDWGDGPYCEYCYQRMFAYCEHCLCDFARDEAEELTYRYRGYTRWNVTVCPQCFNALGGAHCENCGDTVSTEYDDCTTTHDGDVYCETCAERCLARCDRCEKYYLDDDCIHVHCATGEKKTLCCDCDNAGYVVCERCGEISDASVCQCEFAELAEDEQLAAAYVMAVPQYVVYPGLLA